MRSGTPTDVSPPSALDRSRASASHAQVDTAEFEQRLSPDPGCASGTGHPASAPAFAPAMSEPARNLLGARPAVLEIPNGTVAVRSYCKSERVSLELVVLRLSPSATRLKIRHVGRNVGSLLVFHESATTPTTIAHLNGSMYKPGKSLGSFSPMGIVVCHGESFSTTPNPRSGGVLRSNESSGRVWLTPWREYRDESLGPNDSALWLYPMLAERGAMGIKTVGNDEAFRTAVGVTAQGETVLAGVFGQTWRDGLNLYDFAALLLTDSRDGGVGVVDALNVDGGPGSHIYVPSIGRHWGYNGDYFVGNYIQIDNAAAGSPLSIQE